MRAPIFVILTLVLVSCNTSNDAKFSKIKSLENINEEVISSFINQVIDTIIGDCYLVHQPDTNFYFVDLTYGLPHYSNADQLFFIKQVEKLKNLDWEDIITSNRIISHKNRNHIWEKGWFGFTDIYNKGCFYTISIPVFSLDFKFAFIEAHHYSGYGQCSEDLLIFKRIKNRWLLTERMNIGIQ